MTQLFVALAAGSLLIWVLASLPGCSKGIDPETCEKHNTAWLTLANNSDRTSYTVLIDGSRVASLSPGEKETKEVAAGGHTVIFKIANSDELACNPASPKLATCEKKTIGCSVDR